MADLETQQAGQTFNFVFANMCTNDYKTWIKLIEAAFALHEVLVSNWSQYNHEFNVIFITTQEDKHSSNSQNNKNEDLIWENEKLTNELLAYAESISTSKFNFFFEFVQSVNISDGNFVLKSYDGAETEFPFKTWILNTNSHIPVNLENAIIDDQKLISDDNHIDNEHSDNQTDSMGRYFSSTGLISSHNNVFSLLNSNWGIKHNYDELNDVKGKSNH